MLPARDLKRWYLGQCLLDAKAVARGRHHFEVVEGRGPVSQGVGKLVEPGLRFASA